MSTFTFDLHTRLRHAQVTREARAARGDHAGATHDVRFGADFALRLPFDDRATTTRTPTRSRHSGGAS